VQTEEMVVSGEGSLIDKPTKI